jgi:hypothetical protein
MRIFKFLASKISNSPIYSRNGISFLGCTVGRSEEVVNVSAEYFPGECCGLVFTIMVTKPD